MTNQIVPEEITAIIRKDVVASVQFLAGLWGHIALRIMNVEVLISV